jgi:hypothetical protein
VRKASRVVILFLLVFAVRVSFGQVADLAFGVGTVTATSAANAGSGYTPQSVGGGAFLAFSGDFLFKKNFGVNGEIAWRASQNTYTFLTEQPFRPIFYDFNGIWVPKLSKHASAELMAGIGAQSVRFYQPFITCSGFSGCTNYTSTNNFMGHFGGGVRLYVWGNLFVRPEAHYYLIHNNTQFSGPWAARYGASLGYSFGGER